MRGGLEYIRSAVWPQTEKMTAGNNNSNSDGGGGNGNNVVSNGVGFFTSAVSVQHKVRSVCVKGGFHVKSNSAHVAIEETRRRGRKRGENWRFVGMASERPPEGRRGMEAYLIKDRGGAVGCKNAHTRTYTWRKIPRCWKLFRSIEDDLGMLK